MADFFPFMADLRDNVVLSRPRKTDEIREARRKFIVGICKMPVTAHTAISFLVSKFSSISTLLGSRRKSGSGSSSAPG